MRHLAEDEDVFVRCTYADCLPILAEIGLSMLEMGEALRSDGSREMAVYDDWQEVSKPL